MANSMLLEFMKGKSEGKEGEGRDKGSFRGKEPRGKRILFSRLKKGRVKRGGERGDKGGEGWRARRRETMDGKGRKKRGRLREGEGGGQVRVNGKKRGKRGKDGNIGLLISVLMEAKKKGMRGR